MKHQPGFNTKKLLLLIIAISIVFVILTWERRQETSPIEKSITTVIIPIQKGVTYFGDWINQKITFFGSMNELEAINTKLNQEVSELRYENRLLQLDKLELERLRELYELDQQYADYPKTGARVIGKDPGNWYEVFLIDKGSRDGIKNNSVVMADGGLVGRIIEVGPDYAKVRTIIDDTSSVSSMILRTADICVVSGNKEIGNEGNALIEYIEKNVNIVVGDEIVTSHLGSIYPPGILVGIVKSINVNPNKLTKTAILKPIADLKHLQEVLVINMEKDRLNTDAPLPEQDITETEQELELQD